MRYLRRLFFFGILFLLYIITEVVSPSFESIVYLSDLRLDGILVPLKLLLRGVSSDPSTTES